MKKRAINNPINLMKEIWNVENKFVRKIVSLNIQNLTNHLDNLKADQNILKSNIICLQETLYDMEQGIPQIPGYTCKIPMIRKGKGAAIYIKNNIAHELLEINYIMEDSIQCIKLSFECYDLITINQPPSEVSPEIKNYISI